LNTKPKLYVYYGTTYDEIVQSKFDLNCYCRLLTDALERRWRAAQRARLSGFSRAEPDMPLAANTIPMSAHAVDGEVVLSSPGPGVPVSAAFTPEAVLASLEPMRQAAETALEQRRADRS
jgi:hypothetical protein